MKRMLIFLLFLATQLPAFALPKLKKCTCYTGWSCYNSDDGGSHCTSSGASWYQVANQPCGAQYFISGTSADFSTYAPPGGDYAPAEMISYGPMTSGSEIPPGCN